MNYQEAISNIVKLLEKKEWTKKEDSDKWGRQIWHKSDKNFTVVCAIGKQYTSIYEIKRPQARERVNGKTITENCKLIKTLIKISGA